MPQVIRIIEGAPQVVADGWVVVRGEENPADARPDQQIVPLSRLLEAGEDKLSEVHAVWIAPDDDFESAVDRLLKLKLIAVDFPSFRDGRGYSIAYLLRTRYGWTGELRAIGDVLRDQLNHMRRCGFDTFAVRADKDIHDAIKSFAHYSVHYQGDVTQPLPLFRRR